MISLATKHVERYGFKNKIKYIIIDEFQDTSKVRFNLIKAILKKTNASLLVVGDDFQSIYRFTGCDLSLFLEFKTLFKDSAGKVLEYANQAFQTASVSANDYLQQVTSFSASLLSSLSGDTDKAADIANMALIDISDNVNKMGSSMESVTLAYQGFAKQQYMLLDNLKLG